MEQEHDKIPIHTRLAWICWWIINTSLFSIADKVHFWIFTNANDVLYIHDKCTESIHSNRYTWIHHNICILYLSYITIKCIYLGMCPLHVSRTAQPTGNYYVFKKHATHANNSSLQAYNNDAYKATNSIYSM